MFSAVEIYALRADASSPGLTFL